MSGIALHRFDQVRNEIVSPLEGGFNIGPGFKDSFFQNLQTIVTTAAKQKKGENE
jgi:hypothetical protein